MNKPISSLDQFRRHIRNARRHCEMACYGEITDGQSLNDFRTHIAIARHYCEMVCNEEIAQLREEAFKLAVTHEALAA